MKLNKLCKVVQMVSNLSDTLPILMFLWLIISLLTMTSDGEVACRIVIVALTWRVRYRPDWEGVPSFVFKSQPTKLSLLSGDKQDKILFRRKQESWFRFQVIGFKLVESWVVPRKDFVKRRRSRLKLGPPMKIHRTSLVWLHPPIVRRKKPLKG